MGQTSESRAKQKPPYSADNARCNAKGTCDRCGETKPLTEFHKNGTGQKYKASDPRRYKRTCAKCLRPVPASATDPAFTADRKKRRKRDTPEERLAKNKMYKRNLRNRTRIACLKYLAGKGCADCGERDPRVLEFDHINPAKKRHHIATLITGGYAWSSEILRREIRKCRILCANCHRKHTIEQQDYYAHRDVREALRRIYEDYDIAE